MQLRHYYYYYKSIIDKDTCQKIIDIGLETLKLEKEKGNETAAYTFGDRQKQAMPNALPIGERSIQSIKKDSDPNSFYVRDSEIAWLNEQWIYDLVCPLIGQANIDNGWNWEWDYCENFQFTVYHGSSGGFYGWHQDGGSDHYSAYKRYIHGIHPPKKTNGKLPERFVEDQKMVGKVRKLSMTLNLSDPATYDGGLLKFDFGNHAEREQYHEVEEIKEQGSMVVFPSFLDHCVTPVTRGTRYSLVLWCLGYPWR